MKFNQRTILLCAIVLMALPCTMRADSVAIIASKDTAIYESPMNNLSGGGAAGIYVGATGAGAKRRGLLAFGIASSVPAGSTITDVQLRLYLGSASGSSVTIGLHKLSKDWGEGTAGSSSPAVSGGGMGFTASAGDATWADAKAGSVPWSNLGATGDFAPVASASTAVSGPVDTPYIWASTTQMVSDVQSWLDTPATNFGWALVNVNEGTSGTAKAFYSRSATQNSSNVANSLDPTWRPTLTVTYVPEPAAGGFFLITSLLAYLHRRR
jgi:hypothetical protein